MMIIPEPTEIDKRMRRRGEADGDDDDVRWRRRRRRKMAENTADKKEDSNQKNGKNREKFQEQKRALVVVCSVCSVQFGCLYVPICDATLSAPSPLYCCFVRRALAILFYLLFLLQRQRTEDHRRQKHKSLFLFGYVQLSRDCEDSQSRANKSRTFWTGRTVSIEMVRKTHLQMKHQPKES